MNDMTAKKTSPQKIRVAIFGKKFKPDFDRYIYEFFKKLDQVENEKFIHASFHRFLEHQVKFYPKITGEFTSADDLPADIDYFFSIGGDGTFLESVTYIKGRDIPILGINSGRLGFLANVAKEEINSALDLLFAKRYTFEKRALIELKSDASMFPDFNYALNELTVHKKDTASMITVHVYVNGEFLNTYWADGLLISTPTGSTAYSISVGGPIVVPNTHNFLISPIAPHNLTVRPIVVSDDNDIMLQVEGRDLSFMASLDSRSETFDGSMELHVRRAPFTVKMIKLENQSFFKTLRNKLMWGADKRN